MIGALLLAIFLVLGPTAAIAMVTRHLGRDDRRQRTSEVD